MNTLNQVDIFAQTSPQMVQDPNECVRMECGRLIHAAVISQRFMKNLLTNPIKTIEEGFCGEKFTFTQEEKQHIRRIRASSLAEFSNALLQVVELPSRIAMTPDIAYAQVELHK
jgi:hypothetical protein